MELFPALLRFWRLFRRAWVAAYRDNCFGIAKGAAYSSLLAFFPVLTAIATILVQANAESVSRTLAGLVFEAVPPGTEDLVSFNFIVRGHRPVSLLVVATLVAAWAASGVMMSLMEGFRAAYKIPAGRSFVKQRSMAMLLVFTSALPAIGASTLILLGGRTERFVLGRLGVVAAGEQLRGWVELAGRSGRLAIALGAVILVTALLYHLGPNRPQRWRLVWPGAFVATGLWWPATWLFAWYVRNIAGYNLLYGSVGAAIALLVWMYVLAVIALVGCEYNAQRET